MSSNFIFGLCSEDETRSRKALVNLPRYSSLRKAIFLRPITETGLMNRSMLPVYELFAEPFG